MGSTATEDRHRHNDGVVDGGTGECDGGRGRCGYGEDETSISNTLVLAPERADFPGRRLQVVPLRLDTVREAGSVSAAERRACGAAGLQASKGRWARIGGSGPAASTAVLT